jgi:hypothetical protein
MLQDLGWNVELAPSSSDGGFHVIGRRTDEIGIEETIYVQYEEHARPVGVTVVRQLLGTIPSRGNIRAILAAPEGVTEEAAQLAK